MHKLRIVRFRAPRILSVACVLALLVADLSFATSGEPDPTFGVAGKVLMPIGTSNDQLLASTQLPDGKLVVSGYCQPSAGNPQQRLCVARFLTNGALDTAFATDGVFRGAFDFCLGGASLVALPTGDVLVGGVSNALVNGVPTMQLCMARLNSSGSPDVTSEIRRSPLPRFLRLQP